ncbi:MAG: hypothetical protein M5U30_16810 [Burkholderiaceae bacterium]|nr:hypothetical protein [Burkholderiaceae bacterium]
MSIEPSSRPLVEPDVGFAAAPARLVHVDAQAQPAAGRLQRFAGELPAAAQTQVLDLRTRRQGLRPGEPLCPAGQRQPARLTARLQRTVAPGERGDAHAAAVDPQCGFAELEPARLDRERRRRLQPYRQRSRGDQFVDAAAPAPVAVGALQ